MVQNWRLTAATAQEICQIGAQNHRRAREQAGMSLSELAHASGIARSTLARLEAGEGNPRRSTIVALSSALDVSASVLLADMPSGRSAETD
jgi:transcriptional regulator with XRE-family HTH domain